MKAIYFVLSVFFLIQGCASKSVGVSFKGPMPASVSSEGELIPFPSGAIDPRTYEAPKELREMYRAQAIVDAKERGVHKAEDCYSGESDGYYTYCFIVQAEQKLKEFPKNHPLKKLKPEEFASLAWFADFGFQTYNSALWSQDPQELNSGEREIKLALSGLNRIPVEPREVVRCDLSDSTDTVTNKEINKIASRYNPGAEPITIKAFWSTSLGTNPDYIDQWITPCYVQLSISLKRSGGLIQDLSSRPHEQEVLVRPMTKFEIVSKSKSSKNGKDFWQIELAEVE